MGAFFFNMLKKIRTKNKKKYRFATKAQKLLKIKSKRASELCKSSSSSKPSKVSKLRNFCFFKKPSLQKPRKIKNVILQKSLKVAKIEKKRINDPCKSTNSIKLAKAS